MQQGPMSYQKDLTEKDIEEFFDLLRSIQLKNNPLVKSILTRKPYLCSLSTDTGITPLIASVCLSDTCADPDIFNLIINNPYTDLNAQNSAGYSALHFMAQYNYYRLLEIYLNQKNQKISVNLLTSDNVSDLDKKFSGVYLASYNGSKEALYLLIKSHADINLPSGLLKWSPLHVACLNGHEECVFQLLKAEANPEALDSEGATPAHHLAIAQGIDPAKFERIKQLLLDAKVNFRVKSKGFMADEFAAHSGNQNALLLSASLKTHRIPSLKDMCLKIVPAAQLVNDLIPRFNDTKI